MERIRRAVVRRWRLRHRSSQHRALLHVAGYGYHHCPPNHHHHRHGRRAGRRHTGQCSIGWQLLRQPSDRCQHDAEPFGPVLHTQRHTVRPYDAQCTRSRCRQQFGQRQRLGHRLRYRQAVDQHRRLAHLFGPGACDCRTRLCPRRCGRPEHLHEPACDDLRQRQHRARWCSRRLDRHRQPRGARLPRCQRRTERRAGFARQRHHRCIA